MTASVINAAPGTTLPIDPRSLVGLEPIQRGKAYNEAEGGLDSWQRQAVEEALRMVVAGTYPEGAR